MLTFHILDAFAQDEELQDVNGDEKLVTYESEGEATDDEYEGPRKKVVAELSNRYLV